MFSSPTLTFKALQYRSNRNEIAPGEAAVALTPAGGAFDVGPHQVLVKVHLAALNPVDIVLYNSAHPLLARVFGAQTPGRDYSGTVVSIGAAAAKKTDFKNGDHVCGMYMHPFGAGTLGEYILVDPLVDKAIALAPSNVSMEAALLWPLVYGTAYGMIHSRSPRKAPLDRHARVLVIGASTAVGRYLVQMLRHDHDVVDIVGVCLALSEATVKELGVKHVVDYTRFPLGIYAPVEDYVINSGGKFDMIFDCCGNTDFFVHNRIEHVIKTLGDYVTICGDVKYKYSEVNFVNSVWANLYAIGRFLWSALGRLPYTYCFFGTSPAGGWIEHGRQRIESGALKLQVDSVYEFEDYRKAFERLTSNRARGKVVIKVERGE